MKITDQIDNIVNDKSIDAMDVFYHMACEGIDFSECTQREFTNAVKEAAAHIRAGTHYRREA